jgi:predicted cupin superfamily sugar epimerase
MTNTIQDWVKVLNLAPHPEGGFYRETYRSQETIPQAVLPKRFAGPRVFSTAIYYLLPGSTFSAFHRIRSDEIWHFYAGSDSILNILEQGGGARQVRLGADPSTGSFQALAPANSWFGARVVDPQSYALVGCTVSPGFHFADFELADRSALLAEYPDWSDWIESLTRS